MSISDKIKELEKVAASLVDVMDYTVIKPLEITQLLKAADQMRKIKEAIEAELSEKHLQETSSIVGISPALIQAQVKIGKRAGRPIPAAVQSFSPTDTLLSESAVCAELRITLGTLTRWRRNWFGKADIGFPTPVIYVYCSPRWTRRQVEWWLNESNEKVYIKGRENDI